MESNSFLYWKLSGFYFFFFAVGGVFGPYWSLYLKSIGFDAAAIGELSAIFIGASFFAPYLWAWVADHTGKSMSLIRLMSVLSMFAFAGVLLDQSFWWLALVLTGFSFFLNGVLPQLEANTMSHVGRKENHYGDVRLWGSFGFVIAALILGKVLEGSNIDMVPQITLVFLVMVAVTTFFLPETRDQQHARHEGDILQLLTRPVVLLFMAAAFMMFVGYSPYGVFFSIYLEEYGYARVVIGRLWALGMLAEIAVFFMMSRLLGAHSLKALLLAAYFLTTVRWLLIGFFVERLPVLLFAQLLQAATIGIYHTVSIYVIHLLFKGRYQYRGQAAYVCVIGIASFAGILCTGYLWERLPASAIFSLAALATVIAFIITWRFLRIEEPGQGHQGAGAD